ncbi:hypothetical protein CLOSTHATH_06232 [Hungatella hathewayi DSM 13479]|uniref:Uncharacterized protein n=1 Tax=Hungatella hathewayi DSM 13479 TaxID=566550 RepID=D3ARH6_9FIRM|nr:hypothetical protein CLOSTHATH_06232 [Hungatella hathewayi DSM 13479]
MWKLKVNRQIGGCVVLCFEGISRQKEKSPQCIPICTAEILNICFLSAFYFCVMYHLSF